MTHTPGPWLVEPDEWTGGESDLIVGNMNASPNERYIICMLGDKVDKRSEADIANARLIAAAPCLLEACKLMLSLINECADEMPGLCRGGYEQVNQACDAVSAAIAKAEGRDSEAAQRHEHDASCRYIGLDMWDCGALDNSEFGEGEGE